MHPARIIELNQAKVFTLPIARNGDRMKAIRSHWISALILSLAMIGWVGGGEVKPLDVWPAQAPGDSSTIAPEKWDKQKVTNVTHPTLTVLRPAKEKDTGIAILICPGGGYKNLMMDYEGEDVARWLNTLGITGIVLKYRVPAPEGTPRYLPALQDAQRSLSFIRSKAKEWNLDPARIGILGFSAGGHLATAVSTNYDKRAYEPLDAVDQVSCRPDFAVVIYPGGVIQKSNDKDAPPSDAFTRNSRDQRDSPGVYCAGR